MKEGIATTQEARKLVQVGHGPTMHSPTLIGTVPTTGFPVVAVRHQTGVIVHAHSATKSGSSSASSPALRSALDWARLLKARGLEISEPEAGIECRPCARDEEDVLFSLRYRRVGDKLWGEQLFVWRGFRVRRLIQ